MALNNTQKILYAVLIFFLVFAIRAELADYADPYVYSAPQDTDTLAQTLRKIGNCLTYERKTVRWRRSLMISIISIILLFLFIYTRFPTPKECLLHVAIVFVVSYFIWQNYVANVSKNAIKIGQDNIEKLKQTLMSEKSYILPWK